MADIDKLKNLLEVAADGLSKEEFNKAFKALSDYVQRVDTKLTSKIDTKLSGIKSGEDGQDGDDGEDGYTPIKGKDYFDGESPTKEELLALIMPLVPEVEVPEIPLREISAIVEKALALMPGESSETIRNKLELLEGDDRLDASAIKNLPEAKVVGQTQINHLALYALSDVDLAGIIPGQSIQWDGVRWTPYTPAGSGGTPVWGEILQTQSPTGTVFNLAFTPIAGSVRVFRGGSYQSIGNGDYTISGGAITLSTALQSGETLTADYSH